MITEDGTLTAPIINPKVLDKEKITRLLYCIYAEQGTNLHVSGIIAKKYYCRKLWEELFDDQDYPSFMM